MCLPYRLVSVWNRLGKFEKSPPFASSGCGWREQIPFAYCLKFVSGRFVLICNNRNLSIDN